MRLGKFRILKPDMSNVREMSKRGRRRDRTKEFQPRIGYQMIKTQMRFLKMAKGDEETIKEYIKNFRERTGV